MLKLKLLRNNKIKIFLFLAFLLLVVGIFLIFNKPAKRKIKVEVGTEVDLKKWFSNVDMFEGETVYSFDKLESYTKRVVYYKNGERYRDKVEIKVVDKTKPYIKCSKNFKVNVGAKDIEKAIPSIDNYDSDVERKIVGKYKTSKKGTYPLTLQVTDSSGNKNTCRFNLLVVDKPKIADDRRPSIIKNQGIDIRDFRKNIKKNNLLGIDISKWQEDIDFSKVKDEVDFIILRLGYQKGIDGSLVLDEKFEENIKQVEENDIPYGVYFYSYALNKREGIRQAKFVKKHLKDRKLEFPVFYDFEAWNYLGYMETSIIKLNQAKDAFIKEIEKNKKLKAYNYGSKYYLENFWKDERSVWLAHYTKKTDFKQKYLMWQFSEKGMVKGIDTFVDLNIYYGG